MEYTVRVRASNGEGYGPFSLPVSVTTYQDGEFFHPLHQQINCFLLRVCTRQQYVSNNNSMPSVATFSADFHVTNYPCSSFISASKPSTIVSATSSATAHVGQTTRYRYQWTLAVLLTALPQSRLRVYVRHS